MLYFNGKTKYAATIKKEKIRSWKEYCNMTTSNNPWNEVYKLSAGKRNTSTQITTLRMPDGSMTADTKETQRLMLDHFTLEDKEYDDNVYHKHVRAQTQQQANTADDREFTIEEIRNAVKSVDDKKAPGEGGITGEIYKQTFKIFKKYIAAMYNGCLRFGIFPKRWKRAELIPIIKLGKEKSSDVSKYRPIRLINVGGKILEKVLINRINHYIYTKGYMNNNQYGFTQQVSTTDAAKAVKGMIEEGLNVGEVIVIVSLDVEFTLNAAWWTSILKSLKDCGCPQNLYNLKRSYFKQRTAILQTNNIKLEKEVSKGCPQGSYSRPAYWNIQYSTLLNINFTNRTKAVAFADDLILVVRSKREKEAENITNLKMSKI
jgi:hypothetical protein